MQCQSCMPCLCGEELVKAAHHVMLVGSNARLLLHLVLIASKLVLPLVLTV